MADNTHYDILKAYKTIYEFAEVAMPKNDKELFKKEVISTIKKLDLMFTKNEEVLNKVRHNISFTKIPFHFSKEPFNRDNQISDAMQNIGIGITEMILHLTQINPDLENIHLNLFINDAEKNSEIMKNSMMTRFENIIENAINENLDRKV